MEFRLPPSSHRPWRSLAFALLALGGEKAMACQRGEIETVNGCVQTMSFDYTSCGPGKRCDTGSNSVNWNGRPTPAPSPRGLPVAAVASPPAAPNTTPTATTDSAPLASSLPPSNNAPGGSAPTQSSLPPASTTARPDSASDPGTIADVAAAYDGSQSGARPASVQVYALGANKAATLGAILCAQGANATMVNSANAPRNYSGCAQKFSTARSLQALSLAPLQADPASLNAPVSQSVLGQFQRNFGVDQKLYMDKMLASGGQRDTLAELIASKIPAEKLAELFPEAGKGEEKTAAVLDLSGLASGPAATTSAARAEPEVRHDLRDKLAAALEEGDSVRNPASVAEESLTATQSKEPDILAPLPKNELGSGSSSQANGEQLNLFGVVHRKYVAIAKSGRVGTPRVTSGFAP